MATILSRETKRALFYHAKPRSGNHGGEAWRGKTKLFWSPGTTWPPCDKGECEDKQLLLPSPKRASNPYTFIILYFHIPHNALCLPAKFCINHSFQMLLGICSVPRASENNGLCKIWGGGGGTKCIMENVKIESCEDMNFYFEW